VLVKRVFLKDLPDNACKNAKEAKKQGLAKIPQGLSNLIPLNSKLKIVNRNFL